ncbi:unnamed protein product [Cyprideis torosa]|nr:unnamed protein product [Cyprideis torosa]CAG0910758.1 unnamed protein product [Cyprideis torosa]
MGCGASYEESAYGTSGQPLSKTPAIGNGYFEQMKNGQHRIVSKEAQVDKETLERYLELERQIQEMEKNAPLSSLEIKTHSLEQLKLDIEKKEAELVELRAKT